ncbi:MAG: hypothetical protein KatS3mg109_1467 [Pirellulaceae bacterium]|nr:MAG: hypothetical protein KatS3mg109_1467 [Pirellulaceae bacterium]GIW93249.1 MAG: hypothetical protein KatS3mg110_1290 [Pirellulaceae bacterium]
MDLLSGSWPGEIYWFRGQPGRKFAAPERLRHKDGTLINCGGGRWSESAGDMAIFVGGAEFQKKGDKTVILYDGKTFEAPPGKSIGITGTASAVHATDWDADGDLDLLVGTISGEIWLVPNEGKADKPVFGQETQLTVTGTQSNVLDTLWKSFVAGTSKSGSQVLRVPHGDAGPFAADWDGDGLTDLLAGAGDGSVWFYRNIGQAGSPILQQGVMLVPAVNAGESASKGPVRGVRAKICVTDWNEDGRLDLLVGDFATVQSMQERTPDQKAKDDELRSELVTLQAQMNDLLKQRAQLHANRESEEKTKKLQELNEELKRLINRMQEIRSQLPEQYTYHGWVWLYLRKPAGASQNR